MELNESAHPSGSPQLPTDKQAKTQSVITSKEESSTRNGKKSQRSSDFLHISRNDALKRAALSLSPKKNMDAILPPLKEPNKKTLILDLDETLVHSSFDHVERPDVQIPLEIEGGNFVVNVLVRPEAEWFIQELSKVFEIVIYTASLSKYADPLITKLDHQGKVSHRLFREHCTYMDGVYIKDLSKLGRELKHMIIIDNAPESYMLHPYNGLPIKSWYYEKEDRELRKLIPILLHLNTFHDVRSEVGKFVIDDLINWHKVEKWLQKGRKKTTDREVTKNEEPAESTYADQVCDSVNQEERSLANTMNLNNLTLKKEDSKTKEKQASPTITKLDSKAKQVKSIQNIVNLKSRKLTSTKIEKKPITKVSNKNFSNLETTVNNNTLNNTLQTTLIDKVSTNNPSAGKKVNYSTPKSIAKINYKINTVLNTMVKETKNTSSVNPIKNQKNESSVNMTTSQEETTNLNLKPEAKTRNLIYSLYNDKSCRTGTAHQNQTQESAIITQGEDDNDKKEKPLLYLKNKSTKSIFKSNVRNPLSFSNICSGSSNVVKSFLQKNETPKTLNSALKSNSKPIQNKLLLNSLQMKKKNSTPRQTKIPSVKDCDGLLKAESNANGERHRTPSNNVTTLQKLLNSKEIKEKILQSGNQMVFVSHEFSRNSANNQTSCLLNNNSSNYNKNRQSLEGSTLQLKGEKKKSMNLIAASSHKKNISFKF